MSPHIPLNLAQSLSSRCHAVRVRLTGTPASPPDTGADAIARRLAPYARLWREDLGARTPAARHLARAERELARPLPSTGPGIRAVLLRSGDGPADLIVVARRDVLDAEGLCRLARHAAQGTAEPPGLRTPQEAAPRDPSWPAIPAWASGSRSEAGGTVSVIVESPFSGGVPDGADEAAWLAALALVLARYGGEPAPAVGIADDRVRSRHLDTGNGSLRDLVSRARRHLRDADARRDAPPAAVGLCLPLRTADGVDYRPAPGRPFPLTVGAGPDATLYASFHEDDFAEPAVRQLLHHLAAALRQVCGDEESTPAATADFLDGPERQRLAALGTTAPPPPRVGLRRIDALVAEQAHRTPDAIAVSSGGVRLTYRELQERAGLLARGLCSRGVGPGDRVGVCLPRSADHVVALLAVLTAGAVYVPVDPDLPADRVAFIAGDTNWRLAVSDREGFPTPDAVGVEELVDGQDEPFRGEFDPADPAYIIHTSGSTGRPKGVLVAHSNVVGLIEATEKEYGLGTGDVWTFFHSSAFDFSVWEIWGCLLTGGHLVVVPYQVSRTPEEFHELLDRERVTVLSQTPSAFSQLLPEVRERPASLAVRLVVFGGEALDSHVLLPWFDSYPEHRCRVVNMYGITETTVHVTAQTITRRMALSGTRSVGRPLPGWHVHVMDEHGRLLPPGASGELVVGGAGVALGYLDRPELTAQRFVPDPFTGGRMYRSGDLGRMLPDGTLEHLGRMDSQVKIRGFRIELDEIRAVLLDDPEVEAAATVVRRADPNDPMTARIDAYVVLRGGPQASGPQTETGAIRRRAARLLPDYMVPATVTAVPRVPLTANGKLDAARLPAPAAGAGTAGPGAAADSVADDALVDALCGVWADLLGREVTPDQNFFQLGGNSLMVVRMGVVLRERGLPDVPPRTLYLNPSVRELALALSTPAG
ncbi:amino acid adenylation domain-containing protein [Streptomyces sp. MMS24-I29]|uniref:amino acid adenylation domain-containing protein n=1 Tax=Streptomyces sp. MMS24-I29 TaxID=3351480 RepID=UPI003C7CCB1B